MTQYPFENLVGKSRKCWLTAFSPFTAMFSALSKMNFKFSNTFILLSASGSNVDKSRNLLFYPFSKRQILDSSKVKELADDNFKFDKNGRKVLQMGRKYCGEKEKLLVTSNFSFSYSVFKGIKLQTRKN